MSEISLKIAISFMLVVLYSFVIYGYISTCYDVYSKNLCPVMPLKAYVASKHITQQTCEFDLTCYSGFLQMVEDFSNMSQVYCYISVFEDSVINNSTAYSMMDKYTINQEIFIRKHEYRCYILQGDEFDVIISLIFLIIATFIIMGILLVKLGEKYGVNTDTNLYRNIELTSNPLSI